MNQHEYCMSTLKDEILNHWRLPFDQAQWILLHGTDDEKRGFEEILEQFRSENQELAEQKMSALYRHIYSAAKHKKRHLQISDGVAAEYGIHNEGDVIYMDRQTYMVTKLSKSDSDGDYKWIVDLENISGKSEEPHQGKTLKELVENKGYTLYRISEITGISYGSLHRAAIKPNPGITLETAHKIADALEMSLDELYYKLK